MIEEVAIGVLTDAIAATGRLIGASVLRVGRGRTAENLTVARYFDTYRLSNRVLALPELPSDQAQQFADALRRDEVQAVLHELLAARLTDAPETDVNRIKTAFELTVSGAEPGAIRIAELLFNYYDGEVAELVGQLEGADPAGLSPIRTEATAARMIAILNAIDRHVQALSSRTDSRTESDFLVRYRRHVREHHGQITPPDFERRRRVPMAELYVPPAFVQVIDSDPRKYPRDVTLESLCQDIDRTVLLGDPGGGKTTAANAIMNNWAADTNGQIPFLVTLREFAASDPPARSVVGHIEYKLETFYQCQSPPGVVSLLLITGRALVIFDGLDELLDTSRRGEVTEIIERFATEYPLARILVTSRLVGYDQARIDDRQFTRYRIGKFTDAQVADYVYKWFSQDDDIERDEVSRWSAAFADETAASQDLRSNPLMLALMCILYRGEGSLPRNRAEVYEQCANLLFRRWDSRRRIYLDLRASHLLEPALRHLAWWLFDGDQAQTAVTERQLIDETAAFLHGRGFESEGQAREAAREFVGFCRGRMWVFSDVGTTAGGETLYSFTHRTFLEYFAAAYLAYKSDTPERLAARIAPHIARGEWEVLGELAVQIKDRTSDQGAQRIYTALIGERRQRSVAGRSSILLFLARSLRSVDPSPQIVRDLSRRVLDHLLEGDTDRPVRYLPLSWLAANCGSSKEIVHEEVCHRIDQLIKTDDTASNLNGIRLGLWLPESMTLHREGDPRVSADSEIAKFWRERMKDAMNVYSEKIAEIAEDEPGIRLGAIQCGILSIERALEMRQGMLPLLQNQPTIMYNIDYVGHLVGSLFWLTHNIESRFYGSGDFLAVGRYLIAHPHPPWVKGDVQNFSDFQVESQAAPESLIRPLDPTLYLGAAAVLLMGMECEKNRGSREEVMENLGRLNELRPYIVARWENRAITQDLPDLPLQPDFREIFRDWAKNKIDFVYRDANASVS